jgi:hypothetical protein
MGAVDARWTSGIRHAAAAAEALVVWPPRARGTLSISRLPHLSRPAAPADRASSSRSRISLRLPMPLKSQIRLNVRRAAAMETLTSQ